MQWSKQQQDFLTWIENGSGSCVLEAVAGAGKSTTLIEAAKRVRGNVALLAFNKKIAEELGHKLKAQNVDWRKARAGTAHSFGLNAFRRHVPDVYIEGNKVQNLVEARLPNHHPDAVYTKIICDLVSYAKQRGLGLRQTNDMMVTEYWQQLAEHFNVFDGEDAPPPARRNIVIRYAIETLKLSCGQRSIIDFDDMIYLPLFYKLPFFKFDCVMVDEAQDTNTARRHLVNALLKRGGRVVAVGDRHQAIYGFTGADNNALAQMAKTFNCVEMPLTVTYRCPKAVVAHSQQWVNHIEAHLNAPEGRVVFEPEADFNRRTDFNADDAILCRNVKPLISTAFHLIRARIPCRIEGRDLGATLKKLCTRWGVANLEQFEAKLEGYRNKAFAKYRRAKKEHLFQIVDDTVSSMIEIINQCRRENKHSMHYVVAYIDELFSDDVKGVVTLSTIHKAKGREWPRVFLLDRAGTIPSKYAKQDWEFEQETNLCYVAATRAQSELIEVVKEPKKG